MEIPIKVAVARTNYVQSMAFVANDLESFCVEGNKFEAIVNSLLSAGLIEIIDLDNRPKRAIESPVAIPALSPESPEVGQ